MKRFALLAAVCLLPIAACSSSNKLADATPAAAPMPMLSASDAAFINAAAPAGAAEVQFGQLASTKASSPAVRRFAANMVTAHTQVNQQLATLAQTKGVTPTMALDSDHQGAFDALSKLRGRAFDRTYVNGQIQDHKMSLTLFQNEASQGTDPDLKAFAAQVAPQVAQHLAMANKLPH